ncbi:MAG TPA: acetamidase/formamidase family protein [Rugosimonospora sp.]|nr:acetamidase/formamidase family protein [Rugosimonospora sp.]
MLRWEPDPEADRASLVYTFGGAGAVSTLRPGTVLSTWTLDCFGGQVRSVDDRVSEVCDPRYLNPQSGPFWIEGAEPGDTLAVHFISIEPRHTWGVSTTVPFFGALTGTAATALLQAPLDERTWFYDLDLDKRLVRYRALDTPYEVDLPLDPMHGTVGVAPALGEVRSSLAPGNWGGNMDTPEMRAGTTCYLGVNVPGALFSLGDGHARQGEGETCGVAVECAMDTVLVVDLIKGYPTPWPRLEDDEYIMTTGSARPLEDAFRIAHTELVHWVSELTGLSTLDSYQLVSQGARTPVANVVDTAYTVVAKLPKNLLRGVSVLDGTHNRLRQAAGGR